MQSLKYRSGRNRGQALMEFALVLPLLLILTMLIIQYGVIFYTSIGITNVSREGARFAATAPSSDANIKQRISDVMPPNIKYSDVQNNIGITPTDTSTRTARSLITVSVSYDMTKKLFLPSTFLGITIFAQTYTATTTMMVEG